ncbi:MULTISPECIES: hypothetical protein [Sphingobium]|jgi:hypothetical protein|uniref:Uncharacterized protein n=1 Tax=Sphingobium olei TaxID=420955 RepID=A0ABW3NZ03_9SPHN|nr:hypothetical protein [Sphingobium baderi]
MRRTEQLSVVLPNDMPAQVRARVAPGAYASETDWLLRPSCQILPNELYSRYEHDEHFVA